MSLALVPILNTIGLVLNSIGVLLLFFFGMPIRTRTEGKTPRTFVLGNQAELLRVDRRYDLLGRLGLFLIIIGTVVQIYANRMQWHGALQFAEAGKRLADIRNKR